ncbi:hypothetical protein SAMN04490182_4547 [Pseudomonas cedrina]|uniref:Phage tail protein n=2 Tax=Pseudomonas cedrina TaxID=651740 RepID=A0A1V2K7I6_PSECE|nr:hypothetical protein [Pseudomonas cedrina]ONH52821.1 hypothetical protein BLL36_18265 [Pseudomonas cedrina subsp. cedrina]SDT41740.1 hypothetical protein SAMN04490182_4547 [Pseudomonas cedrina]
MHRIDGPGATVDNKFTEGDPVGGIQATVVTDDFLNDVQEEFISVLAAAGVTPVKGTQDQVLQAIYKLVQSQKATAFTAGGSATALTLTPTPAISAYAANQRFTVKFPVNSGLNPTLNVSAKGAKPIKQYDSTGAKVPAVFVADQVSDVLFDGVDQILLDQLPSNSLSDPWALQPIGVPIAVFDHINGMSPPPTNSSYRYIKLTASDSYNTGVLSSESVTGTAPLVNATALISLSGSPINGQAVRLINTERRDLRAGNSGTVQDDQFQGHTFGDGTNAMRAAPSGVSSGGEFLRLTAGGLLVIMNDGTNGVPRAGNETRSRNIGATYYMRIK